MPVRWTILVAVAGVVLAADQATKAVIRSTVELGDTAAGAGPFSIHHVRNSGTFGGHFQGSAVLMAVLTTVAVAGFLLFFARRRDARPAIAVGFGLIVGGGLGNLVDRIRLGYVTDFVSRDGEKAFNLADVSIFLALALLLVVVLLRPAAPHRSALPADRAAD